MKKIFHLASFKGNVGDYANHLAFYNKLKSEIYPDIHIHQEEIRDYYKNRQEKMFDFEFVEKVNNTDLFVIGGGNFFELCWDYSATGTTFDINLDLLKKIKVPILINAIGVDASKGISERNIKKFSQFLKVLTEKNRSCITVRNDGSLKIIQKYFPEYLEKIKEIPDWGFSFDLPESTNFSNYIGVNIAKDMKKIRYRYVPYEEFLNKISKELTKIIEKTSYDILFFPHILSDLEIIYEVIQLIPEKYQRNRISIAPLILDQPLETFKYYQQCRIVYGMRFHSNICSYSLGIPTIAMHNVVKHLNMQETIERSKEFIIDVTNSLKNMDNLEGFITEEAIDRNKKDIKRIIEIQREKSNNFTYYLRNWLKEGECNENK